ncbi:myelin-associated glycoprotein-like [Xenopus laevis]|uniref:Myelin-associated glycoprotein-like n=1 Tax=Xenopus laevis TaxID=8355 RepID=A0A8J1LC96_XENLA|nr:myelin-associated glycoprotein-like [Xenopus laevis]
MELHISSKRIFLLAALQGWFPGSESQDPSVYLPQSITALKGSCVEIPCTINVVPTDFHLIWYREQSFTDPEIFNNKNPSSINAEFTDRTSLVGNKSNSCSLRIDDVRDGGTYYPYIPDKPVLKLPTNLTKGVSVRITCSVRHTCTHNPPVPQWNKVGFNKTDRREELEGGVWRFVQEMDYIPTYQDHGTPIICQSEYPMGRVSQESLILNITYPPQNVLIIKLDGENKIKAEQVTLRCTSNANPPAQSYTWFRINKEGEEEELKEHGEKITINWENVKYFCSARNELGKNDSFIMDLSSFCKY